MPDDSSLRIDIALRAALIAKAVLEMINLDPRLVPMQVNEVAKQLQALRGKVARG
jgi:hypothetical protein